MTTKRIIILLVTVMVFFSTGLTIPHRTADPYQYYIGFSLKPSTNGGLVTFFQLKYFGEELKSTQQITQESFIMQAMGLEASQANPDQVDWMEVYQVKYCKLVYTDSVLNKKDFQCPIITELWKLRYQEYPYFMENGDDIQPGWGKEFGNGKQRPSDKQIQILRKYGIKNWFDIIKGEGAYRLLHDLCDPQWVSNYQAARDG
ncbi:MAG: hypothetical protein KDD36_07785 [Flavobacteriales bacterium]|nr:hypothetical protein [Flavobacteriales bacterium]